MKTFLKLTGSLVITSVTGGIVVYIIVGMGSYDENWGRAIAFAVSLGYTILALAIVHLIASVILMLKRDPLISSKTPYVLFMFMMIFIVALILITASSLSLF